MDGVSGLEDGAKATQCCGTKMYCPPYKNSIKYVPSKIISDLQS